MSATSMSSFENLNISSNSTASGLWHLSSKLGHKLPAVRQRTLQNVVFKVKHGLSPDASQDTAFLQNLLLWFQHDNGDTSACVMLDLLYDLIRQQGVSAKLCSLGLPARLDELTTSAASPVKHKAHRTLTALLHADPACLSQASHRQNEQLHLHDPRSRCQSNSPAGQQSQQPLRQQLDPPGSRQCHPKPVKRMILAPQSSHAFGSQQEVPISSTMDFTPRTAGSAIQAGLQDERLARAMHRNKWQRHEPEAKPNALKEVGWVLQPISVGAADEQYIFDLDVRLQYSDDSTILLQALEELRLGALADMPPEAILQRPSVLKNILALLQSADRDSALPAAALRLLHALVGRIKWALGMAKDELYLPKPKGATQPLQDITLDVQAVHSSYPPQPNCTQSSIVLLDDVDIDVTAAADTIALHAMQLLRDTLQYDSLIPLLHELHPLLLPPEGGGAPLQPGGLQRFEAYLQLVSEALEAQLCESSTEGSQGRCMPELVNLTAASAVVLQLAVQLCQAVPLEDLPKVVPASLARLLGGLAADPIASACLPETAQAVMPLLPSIHLPSFQLVQAATAANDHKHQLQHVLRAATQVSSGNTDAAQWLHQASAALPGLRYLALPNLQQAVASLLDVICCTPALCNPLSGTHDTAAEFGQALLGSSISHVRAAACKALAGAVCVGSAAARSCAAAMVCHQTMLRSLVCTALAEEDSQQHAAQALQAVAQLGSNEQREALLACNVWLTCHAQDPAVGSTISGLNQYLLSWSMAQEPGGKWQQMQPALMDLFRRDPALRADAARRVLHTLPSLAELQHGLSASANKVLQDPFAGLLDNGVGADLTTAVVPAAAQSFSQKDVHQLKSILCTASLNPDIRRSAAEQLLSLTAHQRFQHLLTESAVLYMLLGELSGNMPCLMGFDNRDSGASSFAISAHTSTHQQHLPIGDVQLPTVCLHLLVALVQHHRDTKKMLLDNPDRLLVPLLPLVFSPYITVRRGLATLLALLMFAPTADLSAATTDFARGQATHRQSDSQPEVALPALFLQHFGFPCSVQHQAQTAGVAAVGSDSGQNAEVMQILQQRQLLQSATGIGSLSALLKSTTGSPWLPASLLQQYACMIERTQAVFLIPSALAQAKSADSHAACLQALQRLQQLCCVPQMAAQVAQADWAPALQHLLSQSPNTAEDQQLWLHLLPLIENLLKTHTVQLPTLLLLAVCLRQAALPVLACADAAQAAPSLPVALTHHADASFMFDGAQQQLAQIELMQATLGLLECVVHEAQLLGSAEACCDVLQALDAAALMHLLCKSFVSNVSTAYGTRVAAVQLLTSLFACVRQTWSAEPHGKQPGSLWDAAVVACLVSVVRHVCKPNHDTRLGGLRAKQLLRQALQCLQHLVAAVPVQMWAEEWQQVGGTFWLTRLARDREAEVRAAALSLLSQLAGPEAIPTRRMLLQGWPEAGSAVLKVAMQQDECYAVRAAALGFLAMAMVPTSAEVAAEAHLNQPHQQHSNFALHAMAADARFQPDLAERGTADWLSSEHVEPEPRSSVVSVRPHSSKANLAGPLMLQSSFAAQFYTQDVWDFGIEQLLMQDSFWEQLLSLLEDTAMPAQLLWAATGVSLQAAIADPDFVRARLADSKAWPALLAACRPIHSTLAEQHAQLIAQLESRSTALQGLCAGKPQPLTNAATCSSGRAAQATQPIASLIPDPAEEACVTHQLLQSGSNQHASNQGTGYGNPSVQADSSDSGPKLAIDRDQKGYSKETAVGIAAAQHQLAEAGTAAHVAQLITLFLQTQPGAEDGDASSGYASTEALQAMLHCYVAHAQSTADVLPAPVRAVQAQCQRAQHSMIQHAADAAAALLPQLQLSSQDLAELCGSLPCSLADAAAAVHGSASRLPLPAKLASCRLLANLLPSQEMADAVLPPLAGAQAASMSRGLAALYLELSSRGAAEEGNLSDRAHAAAALRCVLAYNAAAKKEAISQGLHTVLLDCVASNHALLAVKSQDPHPQPQPLQQAGRKLRHALVQRPSQVNSETRQSKSKKRGAAATVKKDKGVQQLTQSCGSEASEGIGSFQGLDLVEVAESESESSIGMHSTSVVEPTAEAASTRHQLLTGLSLLKHLAHNSQPACAALTAAGVLQTARRLWKMALGHVGLLHEVLGLLANMFPGCLEAQRAFCSAGSPALLQRCLDLVCKPTLDLPTLELVVTVIANLACTSEGCLLLLRSNLLHKLEQQLHQLLQRKEAARLGSVLRPLIHLAAQPEGQKQILRSVSAPGLLDLLLTAAEQRHGTASCNAFLVLRNLALATENKAHFVANPRALPVLLAGACRAGQNPQAGAFAAGALWGLVYQGEKVKASLRKLPNAEASLQSAEGSCFQAHQTNLQALSAGETCNSTMSHIAEALKALQMLLLLLDFPSD